MSDKIILFIVEGITEEISFAQILSKLSKRKNLRGEIIRFSLVNGDITVSDKKSKGIKAEIGKLIKTYIVNNHINRSDIKSIVHLIDTDGAYINSKNIIKK